MVLRDPITKIDVDVPDFLVEKYLEAGYIAPVATEEPEVAEEAVATEEPEVAEEAKESATRIKARELGISFKDSVTDAELKKLIAKVKAAKK